MAISEIMTSEGKYMKLYDKPISAEIVATNGNAATFPHVNTYKFDIDLDINTREKSIKLQKDSDLGGKGIEIYGFLNIDGQILYAAANPYMPQYALIKDENIKLTPDKVIPEKYQKGYILRKQAATSYDTFTLYFDSAEIDQLPKNRQFKIRIITTDNGASPADPEIYEISDVVFNTNDIIDRKYHSFDGKFVYPILPVNIGFSSAQYGNDYNAVKIEVNYGAFSNSSYDVFELEFL